MLISINEIQTSPRPVRSDRDEEEFQLLVNSMLEQGLIIPIKVREVEGAGVYEVVYGHRRLDAAQELGWENIEAIIEGMDDTTAYIQSLIENEVREGMCDWDRGAAFVSIMKQVGWSQHDLGRHLGISHRTIGDCIKYYEELTYIDGKALPIPEGITKHHVTLVRQSGLEPEKRADVLQQAADEGWSADEARQVADDLVEQRDFDELELKDEFSGVELPESVVKMKSLLAAGTDEAAIVVNFFDVWRQGLTFINKLHTEFELNDEDIKYINKNFKSTEQTIWDLRNMVAGLDRLGYDDVMKALDRPEVMALILREDKDTDDGLEW